MKKLFLVTALIATLVPVIFVIQEVGGVENWRGVLPKGTTDSLYYYARIHEVVDGHPLIGNPYAYEHRGTLSPAFFLPDVVSSIPMLLGIPFNIAVVINVFVWGFIFLMLSFTLLRLLQMPKGWSFLFSVLVYVSAYSFMLRPTIMQIVYPVFLAFLIALLKFLYEPNERQRIIWLSLAAALTFYTYTYLSYFALLVFAPIFFWYLFSRQFKELRSLVLSGMLTAILIIPFGIYTLLQMSGPYYFETLTRIGLVYTRIPAIEAFFYGRWIVIALITLGSLWFFFPKKEGGDREKKIFWFATGAALFVGLFLNVITGVELTLAVHIGRFVILWMAMILGVLLYDWHLSRKANLETRPALGGRVSKFKYAIVAIFLVILMAGVMKNIPRGLDFFKFNIRGNSKIADLQSYAGPLKWLEENEPEESVIWANESLSEYIPIMTRHYPLSFHGALLHSISTHELEERYLLSRSLNDLTVGELKQDFGYYSGAGANKEQPRVQNQRAWLCERVSRFGGPSDCPPRIDAITLRGEDYFKNLAERFDMIKKNQAALLKQYNVKYILIDRARDNSATIFTDKALYDNGRFVILPLPL